MQNKQIPNTQTSLKLQKVDFFDSLIQSVDCCHLLHLLKRALSHMGLLYARFDDICVCLQPSGPRLLRIVKGHDTVAVIAVCIARLVSVGCLIVLIL